MAFTTFPGQAQGIGLLQRSLERGRLAHAYLFAGDELEALAGLARTLAKTLNCERPVVIHGAAIDCCDECISCRKIDHGNHADVHWVRPESKSRVVTTDQIRSLMREIQLKPNEAEYKVAIIVAADRLRVEAANAFLKTLEEPPPKSILILLSTEPQRILETILSRCLRLNFGGHGQQVFEKAHKEWLALFGQMAATNGKHLLNRYLLLDVLLKRLTELKTTIEEALTARSPLQQYKDAEKELVDKWEDELSAAIEAEYRRQRADLLRVLQWWLRDVWLQSLAETADGSFSLTRNRELLSFPEMDQTRDVARRISGREALENLQTMDEVQGWLGTNVQEALALEVGLLKLRL